eukprot:UN00244
MLTVRVYDNYNLTGEQSSSPAPRGGQARMFKKKNFYIFLYHKSKIDQYFILFLLGKDLALHFKQFQSVGLTFFNYLNISNKRPK